MVCDGCCRLRETNMSDVELERIGANLAAAIEQDEVDRAAWKEHRQRVADALGVDLRPPWWRRWLLFWV